MIQCSDSEKITDLLSTVSQGGCSAKLSPKQLDEVLGKLNFVKHPQLIVDVDTHDDAAVYKLNEETAIIFTTDFFPPVCSDGYDFGQIAAANALSDVFAMGGKPLLALNIMMFSADKMKMSLYVDILRGGGDKVTEAGALLVGGHTIDDFPPKYGLAVVGLVHPNKVMTNAGAAVGDKLILTKPIGTGAIIAAHRLGLADARVYAETLELMKFLNKSAAEKAAAFDIKGATDITGFGLIGHASKMAKASKVSFVIKSRNIPTIDTAVDIYNQGCIPGAAFRNYDYIKDITAYGKNADYNLKMLACDPQTSGGLLLSAPANVANQLVEQLSMCCLCANVIGEVVAPSSKLIYFD